MRWLASGTIELFSSWNGCGNLREYICKRRLNSPPRDCRLHTNASPIDPIGARYVFPSYTSSSPSSATSPLLMCTRLVGGLWDKHPVTADCSAHEGFRATSQNEHIGWSPIGYASQLCRRDSMHALSGDVPCIHWSYPLVADARTHPRHRPSGLHQSPVFRDLALATQRLP